MWQALFQAWGVSGKQNRQNPPFGSLLLRCKVVEFLTLYFKFPLKKVIAFHFLSSASALKAGGERALLL